MGLFQIFTKKPPVYSESKTTVYRNPPPKESKNNSHSSQPYQQLEGKQIEKHNNAEFEKEKKETGYSID